MLLKKFLYNFNIKIFKKFILDVNYKIFKKRYDLWYVLKVSRNNSIVTSKLINF